MSESVISNVDKSPHGAKALRLREISEFPGWERSGAFLKQHILSSGAKVIGDVGGGRLPRIGLDFVKANGLGYHLFDISAEELARADSGYHKVCMDIACDDAMLERSGMAQKFDLIFSNMLLEHLVNPLQAHRNIFKMLQPGGTAVHMFPSRNNFQLFINGLIPEAVSYWLLKLLQPHRDTDHQEGKFEAYYHLCGPPSDELKALYESVGYQVVNHTSYVGHDYYKRLTPLAAMERALRPLIIKAGMPIIAANLLILRKPKSA